MKVRTIQKTSEWGSAPTFQVPHAIGSEEALELSAAALSVFLFILQTTQSKLPAPEQAQDQATFAAAGAEIARVTGFGRTKVVTALKELEAERFIRRSVPKAAKGTFDTPTVILLNPSNGTPLLRGERRSLVHTNGFEYFLFPTQLVTETQEPWSLANLSSSALRLYVAILKRARRKTELWAERSDLLAYVHMVSKTMNKAAEELELKGLVQVERTGNRLHALVCNPLTREPLAAPAVNFGDWKTPGARLSSFNRNPQQALEMLMAALDGAALIPEGNHEYKISCPYHDERTPSCGVNTSKQVFNCFGCHAKGTLSALLRKLTGSDEGVVGLHGKVTGSQYVHRNPDAGAEHVHRYLDENGYLVKTVLRFRNDDGSKRLTQYRPGPNGSLVYDGCPTMLYRLPEVMSAPIVCICEGEKDADSLAALDLRTDEGRLVACTTSGGSISWQDGFAEHLVGKQVVIIPHVDDAGAYYAKNIIESLTKRNIEYRVVDLSPFQVKDVSEYIEQGQPISNLVELMGPSCEHTPAQVEI